MVIAVGAALGLIGLLARRSLWRAVTRAFVGFFLVSVATGAAILIAGPHWPLVAVSVVLLVLTAVVWKTVRWARAVHAVAIARLAWFGWQWVMDIRDSRAWTRENRPVPPVSS